MSVLKAFRLINIIIHRPAFYGLKSVINSVLMRKLKLQLLFTVFFFIIKCQCFYLQCIAYFVNYNRQIFICKCFFHTVIGSSWCLVLSADILCFDYFSLFMIFSLNFVSKKHWHDFVEAQIGNKRIYKNKMNRKRLV